MILEDVYMSKNAKTAIMLGQTLGALQIAAYEQLGTKPMVVGAGTWRNFCGIKGRKRLARKENTQQYIKKTFDIVASFDCADAICIALYGYHEFKFKSEIHFE